MKAKRGRNAGGHAPLLLFLPSVPSGAAAETGPTKGACYRSCKRDGRREKGRRTDEERSLEAEGGKRERKKRSLVLSPSPRPLPSLPRGENSSCRGGHGHEATAERPAVPCRGQAPDLAFRTQPAGCQPPGGSAPSPGPAGGACPRETFAAANLGL